VQQGPGNCSRCAHARDGPNCVAQCVITQYQDSESVCQPCYEHCMDGCTGPGPHLGYGGCNKCGNLVLEFKVTTGNNTWCMKTGQEQCDEGYYRVSGLNRLQVQNSSDPKIRINVTVVCNLGFVLFFSLIFLV